MAHSRKLFCHQTLWRSLRNVRFAVTLISQDRMLEFMGRSSDQTRGSATQPRTVILGLGTGRCGARSLASLLDKQPGCRVSHEVPPLLDWHGSHHAARLKARIERMARVREEPVIGDVASFYLPYAEPILEAMENVKLVCLRRDREATIASFCRWLDRVHPLPTNHWSVEPPPGYFHDPFYTRVFPKYDTATREEGIRLYWDEYYQRAEELANRYPDRFRLFDMDVALNSEEGQRDLLSFCGFEVNEHVVIPNVRDNPSEKTERRYGPASFSPNVNDPRRCVVLVPYTGYIVAGCEEAPP